MSSKFFLFSVLLVVNASCTLMKQVSQQKITTTIDRQELNMANHVPLISVQIDEQKTNFLLDTGATFSILQDSTIVPTFSSKKFSYFGFARGADRKRIKSRFLTVGLTSKLFESNNKVVLYAKAPESGCKPRATLYSGIIGMDFFFDQKTALQLDFSTNTIANISAEELPKKLALKNYTLLSSECKNNQIFIFITIEGKTYRCKLDTGYSGNIIIPESDKVVFQNPNKLELVGTAYQTVSSYTVGKETYYDKMPVTIGKTEVLSEVSVSSSIKAQNIGVEFMKGFDWIIDYNNNKVYVNRNQQTIPSTFNKKIQYFAKVMDNQLQILLKEKNQNTYAVGDVVVSVNGTKVTPENQCEFQDLLNKTAQWDTLQLEVISKK